MNTPTTKRRVRGVDYNHQSFTSVMLANVVYTDCDFARADFNAIFPIKNVTFDHCDLSHASFATSLYNVTFVNSTLSFADFSDSILNSVHFEDHNADAGLIGARLSRIYNARCTLPNLYTLATPPACADDRPYSVNVPPAYVTYDFDAMAEALANPALKGRAAALATEHPQLPAASLCALLRASMAPRDLRDILRV